MNKKLPLLLLASIALTSCAKTEKLYTENQYNSPVFDENYYVDWEGIDKVNAPTQTQAYFFQDDSVQLESDLVKIGGRQMLTKDGNPAKWGGYNKNEQFGYSNNLSQIEKKFNYGVTSKLFDGRVRCESFYQKSRVQVDKSGFAMYFPKALKQTSYLAFACRGGTDYPAGQEFRYSDLKINVTWTFYIHVDSSTYSKVIYNVKGVKIPVDNGGNTALISLTPFGEVFTELYDATAMSFTWEYADTKIADELSKGVTTHKDLVDDYTKKDKHHLALMLYEVFIGDSIWG